MPTAEVCRRHGLGPATFYKLRSRYGAMEVSEAASLKALEDENAKLKRLLADTMLDNVVLKDLLGKNRRRAILRSTYTSTVQAQWRATGRREAALTAMRDHDISQCRACQLVGVDPTTVRRTRPPDCPEIREERKEIAGKRHRFGRRRIGILLERKGMLMNHSWNGPWPRWGRVSPGNALSALPRRGTVGEEAGPSVSHADAGGGASQGPLVARLPGGQLRCLAQVPHSGGDRRSLRGEPVPDCRHKHLGRRRHCRSNRWRDKWQPPASWMRWFGPTGSPAASSATTARSSPAAPS